MDFGLSDEQRMLIKTVRRFVATELIPREDAVEQTGALPNDEAATLLRKSREVGLYAMNIPDAYGGGGLSAIDTMLVEEQFGHTLDILIRRAFGNVYESLLEANVAQKERWLLPTVRGERTCSIAFTEPGAGSDAAGIGTRAMRENGGWVLNGNKHFVSDGAYSDFFIVSAVTDPASRPRHISLFLVDKTAPGVSVGPNQPMMGLTGTSHVPLFFDNVRLGPEHLLGGEGQGLRIALQTLGRVRLAQVCARAVGKASRLLALATDYANQRQQFGKAIGEFQMIQQMIADSVIDINGARLMVLRAAWELDQGRDARDWISMAKVEAAETLGRVADRAVQIFGGMGYCAQLPIERLYRDARIFRIFDGTSEIHRMVIARSALKNGAPLFDIAA